MIQAACGKEDVSSVAGERGTRLMSSNREIRYCIGTVER